MRTIEALRLALSLVALAVAHALTPETNDTLVALGMSIDEAAQLYREKLG